MVDPLAADIDGAILFVSTANRQVGSSGSMEATINPLISPAAATWPVSFKANLRITQTPLEDTEAVNAPEARNENLADIECEQRRKS